MKALKEFDYDLWTTEEKCEKRYWIRVKKTGETSEVTHEVMKFLRNEEKQMRREIATANERGGADLSYDIVPVGEKDSTWLQDPINMENMFLGNIQLEEFKKLLTPLQCSVLEECIMGGKSHESYAEDHGVGKSSVSKHTALIRKKAKKFFI